MTSINGTITKHILLTIDVEDWFQVENFKPWIPFETWDQRELRVERNVHRLLDLMDSVVVAGKPESLEGGKAGRREGEEAGGQEVEISPRTHQLPKLPGCQASRPPSLTASQLPSVEHPWEFDPEQPRVNQAAFNFKFRHYTNLNKTQAKLKSLIENFAHCCFLTCSRYLELNGGL